MSVFMISYDLHSPTNNREKVEESIKSLGTWCKYLTTTFVIKTSLSKSDVQSKATANLDGNDAMIIAEVTGSLKGWLSAKQWDWINKNLC